MINLSDWLEANMNKKIEVETVEGCKRRGVLTGVRAKTIQLDNAESAEPRQIILDHDEGDPTNVFDVVRYSRL